MAVSHYAENGLFQTILLSNDAHGNSTHQMESLSNKITVFNSFQIQGAHQRSINISKQTVQWSLSVLL